MFNIGRRDLDQSFSREPKREAATEVDAIFKTTRNGTQFETIEKQNTDRVYGQPERVIVAPPQLGRSY
jgi:hypothetical protein